MKLKKFFTLFDKKKFLSVAKITLIFLCLVGIINLIGTAYSRYESSADLNARANVAFFIIEQGTYEDTISLTGLTPSPNPLYYIINVSNFNSTLGRANVDIEYSIKFEVTTNIPLEYEVICNDTYENPNYENILSTGVIRTDDDGVYYKVFESSELMNMDHDSNHTDQYVLKVTFPEIYKDSPNDYQGLVELFSVIVHAEQVA